MTTRETLTLMIPSITVTATAAIVLAVRFI